jgi:hypothetical protein
MFDLIASETYQPACQRKDVHWSVGNIHAKFASLLCPPAAIEIADERQLPVIVFFKLIKMAPVECAGGINCHMDLGVL